MAGHTTGSEATSAAERPITAVAFLSSCLARHTRKDLLWERSLSGPPRTRPTGSPFGSGLSAYVALTAGAVGTVARFAPRAGAPRATQLSTTRSLFRHHVHPPLIAVPMRINNGLLVIRPPPGRLSSSRTPHVPADRRLICPAPR